MKIFHVPLYDLKQFANPRLPRVHDVGGGAYDIKKRQDWVSGARERRGGEGSSRIALRSLLSERENVFPLGRTRG